MTLAADTIPEYTTTITGNSKEGFVITNKHRSSGTNLDPDPDPGPGPNPNQETLIVIPPSNPANLEEVSVKGKNGFQIRATTAEWDSG